jgi:acetolactate synthase-1/2/3 large subunit
MADLLTLQNLVACASRPLLVAGGGVSLSGGGQALTALAERYRVPVVTTMTGRNAIPDLHGLALGIVGDNGFLPQANRAMEESDLLVYIGCRIGSVVSIGWTFPPPRPDRKIVQVDICPEFLANNTLNVLSICGDARAVIEQLNALPMPASLRTDPNWIPTLQSWSQRFWRYSTEQLSKPSAGPLQPQAVIDALNRRMHGPHFLFADPGTATSYLNRFLRLSDPRSRVVIPRAYGGLGYAIPAVIGSWFAQPGVRPIALFGDGSFGMSVGELESITRLQVPAILLNFNNSSFGWIKALQKSRGASKPMSVDLSAQDAAAIARGFGLRAVRVDTLAELESGLDVAFAHDGPVLLDIMVESVAEVVPPVYKWLRQAGIDPLAVGGQPLI